MPLGAGLLATFIVTPPCYGFLLALVIDSGHAQHCRGLRKNAVTRLSKMGAGLLAALLAFPHPACHAELAASTWLLFIPPEPVSFHLPGRAPVLADLQWLANRSAPAAFPSDSQGFAPYYRQTRLLYAALAAPGLRARKGSTRSIICSPRL